MIMRAASHTPAPPVSNAHAPQGATWPWPAGRYGYRSVALRLLAIASMLALWDLKTIREALRLRWLIPRRTLILGQYP